MKILYVTDALAIWGGTERIIVDKANYLAGHYGYDVHIVTANQGGHPVAYPLHPSVTHYDLSIRFHLQYQYGGIKRFIKSRQMYRLYEERLVSLNPTPTYSDCETKSVIFVGRFSTQKGIPDLLKIWKLVYQRHPDWQLHMYAGYGDEDEKLKSYIEEMGKGVVLHEPTSDIFSKYKESSMLLLTSIFEPFGLVMPEAMSCGLPVVAFDCPYGPADIITDGEDGFLIKNRDIHAFADKVCQLIENPQLRTEMGQRAIASSQRFSPEKIMPMWKQLFESMVSHS